jgi:hypothetical protein
MMQELSAGLRQAGLNIFRHRRGMLFVSPIRARVFGHERAGVSASINGILEKVAATPGINRKLLAEQITLPDADAAAADRAKMTLAHDLHWLIREGYVIEFNDGSLDLPRAKAQPPVVEEKPAGTVEAAPAVVPAETAAAIDVVPMSSVLSDESGTQESSEVGDAAISAVEKPSVVAQE